MDKQDKINQYKQYSIKSIDSENKKYYNKSNGFNDPKKFCKRNCK